jgi:hydrogenase nickel incorporation protein HypB
MMMEVEVGQDVLAKNDQVAQENKKLLAEKEVFAIDLVGSPGCGKTSLLEKLLKNLGQKLNLAVIEGDLYTSKDADRIEGYGSKIIQINTKGACHLEALSIKEVLEDLALDQLDGLIIENVGNLVCPASFALGTDMTITVLSVPEGNDKPLKYPALFEQSSAVVINKIDLLDQTNFSLEEAQNDLTALQPELKLFPMSCSSEEGLKEFYNYLKTRIEQDD